MNYYSVNMRSLGSLLCTRCLFATLGYYITNQIFVWGSRDNIIGISQFTNLTRSMGSFGALLEVYVGIVLGEIIHETYYLKI